MNKQIAVYPYNEILFSTKKELNVDICNIGASLVAQTVKNPSTMQETWVRSLVSLVAQLVKNLPAVQETRVQSLGWEDPLEKEMATHSSILAWKISWTEEPGGLQSMGSQRVGHN